MEQLLEYLPNVLTWSNFLVLVCGSVGGLFFGAMPGLSPTMAVALLVPFTFYMPPVPPAPAGCGLYFRRGGRLHFGHFVKHPRGARLHCHPA